MRILLATGLAMALAGCVVAPQHGRYAQDGAAQPRDPSQWRVVSVTPVPAGTAARIAASSSDGKPIEYSSSPAPQAPMHAQAPIYAQAPVYTGGPVYAPAPVYYPAPVYAPEPAYFWPPVSLSLGFVFGRHWGGGARWGGHRRFR